MPYIKQSFIENLLERAHIDEVINRFLSSDNQLKRSGANFKAKSPFVEERSPSFVVSPVKNIWKDFASQKSGNMVTFVMESQTCSYPEAIEKIAGIYNEVVQYEEHEFSEKKKEQLEKKETLRVTLESTLKLYQEQFKKLPETHAGHQEVFIKRKYDDEVVLDWQIGFAPENFLYDKLEASGKLQNGIDLGLVRQPNEEFHNKYDQYSNRVIYPIHDANGLLIGLAGRDITGKKTKAKWINPDVNPQNVLYNKSKVWFGLHKAKFEIRKKHEAFIVEGYNDVIAWHRYGLINTVAPCGTAIPQEQINIISKLCKKVVFCMDPDAAGMRSVIKYIPDFIKSGLRTEVIILDLDPDDYVREHEEAIAKAEGLENIFKAPGIRRDGFSLLINEKIKAPYYQIEQDLIKEKAKLQHYVDEHTAAKHHLNLDKNELESDHLQAKNLLKDVELAKTKKSSEFKEQNLTVTKLSAALDVIKNKIKNFHETPEHLQQKKIVNKLTGDFELAYENSEIFRSNGAKELCGLIVTIEDKSVYDIYLNWIQKESGIAKSTLNSWVKEMRGEYISSIEVVYDDYEYELPKDVTISFKDLEQDIKMYGLFMANNKIYFSIENQSEGKVHFVPLSNFEIEILQHMADEKFPSLLIRMRNVLGNETIFDCPTETFNSLMRFKDILSKYHNYIFKGKNNHLEKLHNYLFNKMGKGVKLDVLGQQLDKEFWVFNNKIITEDGELKDIDDNGQYIQGSTHYYIASANQLFRDNPYKYKSEKSFRLIQNNISFYELLTQAAKVHRHHYISAILYGITTLFRDIVVDKLNHYPILFLYGQGGTGKDELARLVMSLTGVPQKPISLEAELSTQKATIRVLAQFRNGIVMFSEYKRGNPKQDGSLKGIYDNIGYSIGTIESKFSTDYIPVETGLILTGNEFPESEPLIQRTVWIQMDKNVFNETEKKEMEKLKRMVGNGVSCFAVDFLKHRKLVKERFEEEHSKWSTILTKIFPDVKVRMIDNLAIISAFYGIFENIIKFPFSQFEMIDHFKLGIEQQMFRINSTSLLVKFWDCFISSFRGPLEDRIQAKKIVNIESNSIYLQWTHVYTKIQKQWYVLYRESAPKKEVMLDEIKKMPNLFVGYHDQYSFDTGRQAVRSSAVQLNLSHLDIKVKNDVLGAFMEQVYSESLFEGDEFKHLTDGYLESDSTPIQKIIEEDAD